MAEVTLQVGGIFQAGDKVEAYRRGTEGEFGGRRGKPEATAKVGKDTEVTLKGLVDSGQYWVVGDIEVPDPEGGKPRSETRALSVLAHDDETRSLHPDVAVTQAATRRVDEKVAEATGSARAAGSAQAAVRNTEEGLKWVEGPRSVAKSRPSRSTKRGADSPRARKSGAKKATAPPRARAKRSKK